MKRSQLTPQEADELADYIETLRPSDLGAVHLGPGARGRPPLTAGATRHSPTIHVRVPEALYSALSAQAHVQGVTVSALVRAMIERAVPTARGK